MERQIIIKQNIITGEVTWENPDAMTRFEAVSLMEWTKMMMMANIIEECIEEDA